MLRSPFRRTIIARRAVKHANIVWSVPRTPPINEIHDDMETLVVEHFEKHEATDYVSSTFKKLADKAIPKEKEEIKQHVHKLTQEDENSSYCEPEIIQLFDLEFQKVELHPDIFAANINQDHIYQTLKWQQTFKTVDMSFEQDRHETGETPGRQPWGGSGFGMEMVRDKTGPRFVGGQFSTEPRRPFISNYYRLGRNIKLSALCSCLTIKHFQDDLIVVSDYGNLNRINPAILKRDVEENDCSFVILKTDHAMYTGTQDLFDKLYGTEKLMNVFPAEGLNVLSLLKHDKLVMDLKTLEYIQKKLLFELNRYDLLESHDEPDHPLLDTFWHEISGKWKDESFNQGGYKSGHHRFYKDWPTF